MEKTVFFNVSWPDTMAVKPDFLVTCAKQIKKQMDFFHPGERFNYQIVDLPDIIQMRAVEV